eukprot:g13901.t1
MAVGAGIAARTTEHLSDAWRAWPVSAIASAQLAVRGWLARMDAALLVLPKGLGPAMSSLIRLVSLAIAASILTSIFTRTSSNLLKLPSRASKAVGDPSSYTPGRHNWLAAPSRWDPHYCGVCGEAIAWNSDSGVRCQICGSHAHMSCSKRAHKEGLACKALCSADVELSHKRLYRPLEEDEDQDEEACLVDPEDKPPPIMRHQWIRGSIDDSQPCYACGGSCAGSGATGQHGFSCAWCKLQVHEGCISRVAQSECSLGRHRRLILPPIAVLKDQPRRKRGIIRDAVSKVRRVLPGSRDDECDPPLCVDPNDPDAVDVAAGQDTGSVGGGAESGSEQGSGFVEAIREAAAALDVATAKEVGSRLAEKVRDARLDVAAGLDVAGDSAKEGGRRLAEKVLDAMPIELEDVVWEEALAGSVDKEAAGTDAAEGGEDPDPAAAAATAAAAARSSEAGVDRAWEAALSQGTGSVVEAEDGESEDKKKEGDERDSGGEAEDGAAGTPAETAARGLVGGEKAAPGRTRRGQGGQFPLRRRPPASAQANKTPAGDDTGKRLNDGSDQEMIVSGDGDSGDDGPGGSDAAKNSAQGGAGAEEDREQDVGELTPDFGPSGCDGPASSTGDAHIDSEGEGETDAEAEDFVPPDAAQETILSQFVTIVREEKEASSIGSEGGSGVDGNGVSSPGGDAAAGTREAATDQGGALHLREPSEEQRQVAAAGSGEAREGSPPDDEAGLLGVKSGGQMPGFREVGGVGVAGWSKDGADGQQGEGQPRAVGGGGDGEEVEEEEEEEEEQEWVVKMQELHAKFQTSGEGADATKSVTYTRKTRSVTLTICEENIPDDSCPLLVFINSKSGGKQGGVLLSRFRALLNPLQVSDLSQEDPLEVLHRFRNVNNLRLLACGGDGTVAWLLQSVDAINWKVKRPPLAILPLGTGNDLARVLGWGGGYTGEDIENLLDTIQNAQVTMLDRWSVSAVTTSKGGFRKGQKDRQLLMNNYLGIGVDGQVALDFHQMREARPVLFFSRLVNKALYAQLGVRSALVRACHDLPSRIELRCDGQLVDLPQTTASIIACNINSYGGGSKLWAVEERSRRAWAGRTSNHPLSYPQIQQQRTTMWGFDTSGLVNPGGSLPSGVTATPGAAAPAAATASSPRGGGTVENSAGGGGDLMRHLPSTSGDIKRLRRLRTRLVGRGQGTGFRSGGSEPLAGYADGAGGGSSEEGSWSGSASGGDSGESSDSDEGRWENPRDSRGSSSTKRESKTSFHDGVLEVVAVEGVLHLGQIQLGLSRALAVAQCREMQVKTTVTLPMQVDGEPWKQPPSEITVKLHNQAAMLRPATTTERAVASVLNDVSAAIHGAEQDLIINERQARTLLSRIRRSARLPE